MQSKRVLGNLYNVLSYLDKTVKWQPKSKGRGNLSARGRGKEGGRGGGSKCPTLLHPE